MQNDFLQMFNFVNGNWCVDCDQAPEGCKQCSITELKEQVRLLDANYMPVGGGPNGCVYCKDKNGGPREVFFIDKMNNLRPCSFCPVCGRNLEVDGE